LKSATKNNEGKSN